MKYTLNEQQIEYVFFHLGYLFEITHELNNRVRFSKDQQNENNYILFNLSERTLDLENVLKIEGIPVLFPLSNYKRFYYFEKII